MGLCRLKQARRTTKGEQVHISIPKYLYDYLLGCAKKHESSLTHEIYMCVYDRMQFEKALEYGLVRARLLVRERESPQP